MKTLFKDRYRQGKLLIGMVHTLPLPGSPLYDRAGGVRKVARQALQEAQILRNAGFHTIMYCNESDMPYEQRMRPETIAAMTDVIAECQAHVDIPHGVNMLIDPYASIAIAHATEGGFVRCFLTGCYVGDLGQYVPDAAGVLRMRADIGAEEIAIISNVTAGFSVNLDHRSVATAAKGAVFLGLADAVCVSGPAAGAEAELAMVKSVADAVPDTPVVVGTGVSRENIASLAAVADAFIVGTSIKVDGKTLNPVDPRRADALMQAIAA
ncbi:BtpA/SgcQ family protein [Mesorhizobium koreense]|uniref:BtpA/SgcQ family protein n=1 Tax=Mesorhizobium koreense TaxID=3074855 RepID=UPI00287B77AA|nr:BtpA/SgcQ family protein [Mesorhizobium sp. WR6]